MPASLLDGTTMPTRGAEACVFMHALSANMYTKALHRPSWHSLPSSFCLSWLKERGRMGVREEEEGERKAERVRMRMRKNKGREDGD
jgi:hypothetical protein